MYRGQTVGVVLPAYNEAAHVGDVIESLPAFVDTVYAVDDCSTDDTWDVIRAYAQADRSTVDEPVKQPTGRGDQILISDGRGTVTPAVVPYRHDENKGAGATLKTGYRLAERDAVDVAVTIDADGQMDPRQMPRLLDPIVDGRAGYAKGNRLADGDCTASMPRFRLFGNWLLTLLTKPASGYWRLRDPQNGYTAIDGDVLSGLDIEAIPDDHDYPNELLARLNAAGVRVADVSMPARYGDEESTIEFASFVRRTSKTLLDAFVWRIRQASNDGRDARPLLYGLGSVGVLVGGLSLVIPPLGALLSGGATAGLRLPGAGVLLLAGLLALLFALLAERRDDAEVIRE